MDLTTGAVILFGLKTVGEPAGKILTDLVERFLGPSVDIAGEALRKFIEARLYRGKTVFTDAVQMIHNAGDEPRPVSARIMLQVLEYGSVEEDDELRQRWSALLANASIRPGNILPGFAEILRQMTSVHARVLDWMYEQWIGSQIAGASAVRSGEELQAQSLIDADQYGLIMSDLDRLNLIRGASTRFDTAWQPPVYEQVALTTLGAAFVSACRPPVGTRS